MILQQLYKNAEAILGANFAPDMYGLKPVRWEVCLSKNGAFEGFVSLGGDKEEKRGKLRFVPLPPPRSGQVIKPCILADTPAYVLGLALEEKEKRAAQKHSAFEALVQRCAMETCEPAVIAVATFLAMRDSEASACMVTPKEMSAADLVTFRVGAVRPVELTSVQSFWANENSLDSAGPITTAQCMVTGVVGPIERILQQKINGIPNGNPVGTALLSADKPAFESYGWQQARMSPISRNAAELSTKALNQLIKGDRSHITMVGLVYVFWTDKGGDDLMALALDKPEDTQVRDALKAVWTGQKSRVLQTDAFYGLALSASGGRAVVRDWLATTVAQAYGNLSRWFDVQKMVLPDGTDGTPLGVYRLAGSVYRDARKEMEPAAPQSLVRAALHREPVPRSLLSKAVMRCRIGTKTLQGTTTHVTHAQAAIIKACLVTDPASQFNEKEHSQRMSQLDTTQANPAYLCGRLLAELDYIQYAALGKLNATLVDRYFGAASTAPATVFGMLLVNANKAHLPKLRKSKPGVYQALQKRLEEIVAPTPQMPLGLKSFPTTLTLQDQGLFALGFYHQRAADRKAAQDAKAQKNAALAELAEDPDDPTIETNTDDLNGE
ncbi:MAG: type I-C CRISPR-associated protein Cas8c/Csd1 [Janthinobacterium lividum]